jgi:hypothetical protein
MKNETTYTAFDLEQIALRTATLLNDQLLDDDGFCGYDGSKDDFDHLYLECRAIAKTLIYPSLDMILDTFWEIQNEIGEGQREVDWYL